MIILYGSKAIFTVASVYEIINLLCMYRDCNLYGFNYILLLHKYMYNVPHNTYYIVLRSFGTGIIR